MSTPISFTIRPPSSGSSSSSSNDNRNRPSTNSAPFRIPTAPARPSPLSTSSFTRRSEQGASRRSAFGGDDDDDEDDSRLTTRRRPGHRDEAITGFNEKGLESVNKEKPEGPMVIASLPNRDWRQSSYSRGSRRPTYMPEGGPRTVTADDLVERSGDDVVQGGLQRVDNLGEDDGDVTMTPVNGAQVGTEDSTAAVTTTEMIPLTLEQQALQAVLASGDETSTTNDLTIDVQSDTLTLFDRPPAPAPGDETDAFRQDILTRPEESTMEDYSAVPIESFGAALLRGMGWKPNQGANPKVHEPKRRPAGLGLGASEKPGSEKGGQGGKKDDMGGRAERDRKRREEYATRGGRGYIPVVKRARESHIDSSSSRAGSPGSTVSRVASRASSRSPTRSDTSRRGDRDAHDRNGDRERGTDRRDDRNGSNRDREKERDYTSSRRREEDDYRSSRRDEKSSRYDSGRDRERERGAGDRDRDRYRDTDRERSDRDRRDGRDRDYDRRR